MAFDKKKLDTAASAIQEAGTGNKYLMLQDFDHRVVENYQLIATDEAMDAIAASGKKHITLEKLQNDQRSADNYSSGKISRDEFVNYMKRSNGYLNSSDGVKEAEAVADIIDKAKARGIDVHFVNKIEPETTVNELASRGGTVGDLKKDLDANVNVTQRLSELEPNSLYTDYKAELVEARQTRALIDKLGLKDSDPAYEVSRKLKSTQEIRADNDKQLTDRIVKATNGEPAAIVHGIGHGATRDGSSGMKDLDEHLAPHGKVGKVGISGSEKEAAKWPSIEAPNTMIYTDGGFGKKPDTKIFDNNRPAGAEINTNREPYDVKKSQDYKPEERPLPPPKAKEDKKKSAQNEDHKDPREIARMLKNGELPPASHSHADGQNVSPQAGLAKNRDRSQGQGLA